MKLQIFTFSSLNNIVIPAQVLGHRGYVTRRGCMYSVMCICPYIYFGMELSHILGANGGKE